MEPGGGAIRTRGRTLTEADLLLFSMLSKDWADIHTDHEFVARTVHRRPIAHGGLTLAVACGLVGIGEPVGSPYGMSSLYFPKPAYVGDTLYLEIEPADGDARAATVVNQHGETVLATSGFQLTGDE